MAGIGRGKLTNEIKAVSKKLLGYEINQKQLRLMPYIQYQMMNEQRIDPNKIETEERKILSEWREAGHIEGGALGLSITKHFWNIINEILWLGYAAYRE
jgi:hypothetical protein